MQTLRWSIVHPPQLLSLTPATPTRLSSRDWRAREVAHINRVEALTRDHVARRARGERHPIEDFLFTYYNLKPAQLRRWHPGAGIVLEAAAHEPRDDGTPVSAAQPPPRSTWRDYAVHGYEDLAVDAAGFMARRGSTVEYIEELFSRTMDRPPSLGCFGLHEWAMVYQLSPDEIRHRGLPLRLGALETDGVVESHPIACTHFDAFRFFTPTAVPLNTLQPTRDTQPAMEQAGCLHAGMDVYKWAMKLGPLVPGELLLDTFELAMEIRRVDMRASPYDVSAFGLAPVKIETPEGKSEYAHLQRGFMQRGNELRVRVLEAIRVARACV